MCACVYGNDIKVTSESFKWHEYADVQRVTIYASRAIQAHERIDAIMYDRITFRIHRYTFTLGMRVASLYEQRAHGPRFKHIAINNEFDYYFPYEHHQPGIHIL